MAAERDPHGIVPDGFYEQFDSVREAARDAEVTTDAADRTRCPECDSTNLRYRPEATQSDRPSHHGGTLYLCRTCEEEFDEPEGGR